MTFHRMAFRQKPAHAILALDLIFKTATTNRAENTSA